MPIDDLGTRVALLIQNALPSAREIMVRGLTPMFGGNARSAWAFDLDFVLDQRRESRRCVILSHSAGRQIETNIDVEFEILRALNGKGTLAPAAIAADATGEIVGAPSIVLERLPGKASAVDFLKSAPETARRLTEHLSEVIAKLHCAVDDAPDGALRTDVPAREVAAGQIEHWLQTFLEQRMEPLPVVCSIFAWLRREVPTPTALCLVHGDLRPGNFLYEGTRVTGVLDWEMAHLGDPVEDLAWVYRPMWSPARFLPMVDFIRLYAKRVGHEVSRAHILYYRVFSEMKFATISLTASRAYTQGNTRNLRHIDRASTVAPCLRRALDWISEYRSEVARA